MNPVYILHHTDGTVTIPFTIETDESGRNDADRSLFTRLYHNPGATWDASARHFVLPSLSPGVAAGLFSGLVRIDIDKSPATPYTLTGFFAHPWTPGSAPVSPDYFTLEWQTRLETSLHARKYSPKTITAYVHHNREFCRFRQKTPDNMTAGDVTEYLAYLDKIRALSASSMNMTINALKFFYHQVLKTYIVHEQQRPRQDKRLPSVLSGTEILTLLSSLKNLKHRLLLTLAYSSGLRVSEVVTLKLSAIDMDRQALLIRSGKGRKDRYTMLSDKVAFLLTEYRQKFQPFDWLFPGMLPTAHLSIRSAQYIFEAALLKSGINKQVSIHSLRHSFATHLMENGTAIRYIQELLGHSSIRTTERYTHVAKRDVLKVKSPLDML
jgi:site-specific recombinase XerD